MTTTINNEHKKLNVPNLRFPEFQGEWEEHLLGNISDVTKLAGFEFTKYVTYEDNGNIIAIRGLNCKNGSLDLRDVKYIDNSDFSKLSRSKLYTGDILYTYVGTVGEVAVVDKNDKYYLAPNVSRIRLSKDYNSDFIKQLLGSKKFYNQIVFPLIATSSQPALSMENLRRFKLRVPSIKEQKKIASLFNAIDERIATQNKIIEDLKKLKSAIIENVFDDKHSERLQLDNVGSYIRGLTYSSNDVVEHGGTLVMRSNNIVNGSLLDYNNNVVFVNKQMSAEQQLQNGDIVICMANGSSSLVGKSSFYDGNCHSPITVGAFCGIYRSKEPIVKWLFQTNKYRRYIWNSLQGGNGAIANLNGEDILNMSFSIPNAPIKDTCVKMLTSVDSALENNMSLCALYTLQKQHLLRQMFI